MGPGWVGTVGTTNRSRLVVDPPSWQWAGNSGMPQAVWLLRALSYLGWPASLIAAALPHV